MLFPVAPLFWGQIYNIKYDLAGWRLAFIARRRGLSIHGGIGAALADP